MKKAKISLLLLLCILLGQSSIVAAQESFDESTIYERMYRLLARGGENGYSTDVSGTDAASSDFIRCLFNLNDLPTDNAVCGWDDEGLEELTKNSWNYSLPQSKNLFQRLAFGIYTGGSYLWDWKGGEQQGRTISDHLALFPLPSYIMNLSKDYKQNPGYDDINIKPEGLVMNIPSFANETVDLSKIQGLWFSWQRPTNFGTEYDLTYAVEFSTTADFSEKKATSGSTNAEKLLYDASTLYENMGYFNIADGETATVYARVVCHEVASEPISFKVKRSKIAAMPHTWYILGSPIGDGGWGNNVSSLGLSCVPLGVSYENTFRFAGYLNTNGFRMIRSLSSWDEQVGSTSGSINDYVFNDGGSNNLQVPSDGNYLIYLHYDGPNNSSLNGPNNYLTYECLNDVTTYSSVSIIGENSDWNDVDMTKVGGVEHSWYTTQTFDEDAELKFRANHSWDVNWGAESFPYGIGYQNGANIKVKKGTYTIFFNDITGDYLFLDAETGALPIVDDHIVDDKYLNTEYASIQVGEKVTFNADDNNEKVKIIDPTIQQVDGLRLLIGNAKLDVDKNGMVSKAQLKDAIKKMNNRLIETDVPNHIRTSSVQAVVRGYCDKNDIRVYSESSTFTIAMEEGFNIVVADSYYYVGDKNTWNPIDRTMPLTKEREGVFTLTFQQPAGSNHWFKVTPSTTTDWFGDMICPVIDQASIGIGAFDSTKDGGSWYIPAPSTEKTYTLILDFNTMKYSLVEGTSTDIDVAIGSENLISPNGSWYTLDGRRLNGKPTKKDIYIVNGKKIIIK